MTHSDNTFTPEQRKTIDELQHQGESWIVAVDFLGVLSLVLLLIVCITCCGICSGRLNWPYIFSIWGLFGASVYMWKSKGAEANRNVERYIASIRPCENGQSGR